MEHFKLLTCYYKALIIYTYNKRNVITLTMFNDNINTLL